MDGTALCRCEDVLMEVESESRKGCFVEVVISFRDSSTFENLFAHLYVSTCQICV